jgi:hypothetical protein
MFEVSATAQYHTTQKIVHNMLVSGIKTDRPVNTFSSNLVVLFCSQTQLFELRREPYLLKG